MLVLGVLLGVSVVLNVLLFVAGFRLFNNNEELEKQYAKLKELLFNEAKNNAILQSKVNDYEKFFKQYYGSSDEPKPTMIIDEDWDDED